MLQLRLYLSKVSGKTTTPTNGLCLLLVSTYALASLYQTFSLKLMKEDLLQIVEKLFFNQPLGFIP
jgi:hypothetical protein